MLDVNRRSKEEAPSNDTHKARHVQRKLKTRVVGHVVFVPEMLQATVGNLQCTKDRWQGNTKSEDFAQTTYIIQSINKKLHSAFHRAGTKAQKYKIWYKKGEK